MPRTTPSNPAVYNVVPEDLRVLNGLVPFPISGRSRALPPIYRYEGVHPQLQSAMTPASVVYVYLVDSSPKGRKVNSTLKALTSDLYTDETLFLSRLVTLRNQRSVFDWASNFSCNTQNDHK